MTTVALSAGAARDARVGQMLVALASAIARSTLWRRLARAAQ